MSGFSRTVTVRLKADTTYGMPLARVQVAIEGADGGAELVVLDPGAHDLVNETPRAVSDAMLDFVKRSG